MLLVKVSQAIVQPYHFLRERVTVPLSDGKFSHVTCASALFGVCRKHIEILSVSVLVAVLVAVLVKLCLTLLQVLFVRLPQAVTGPLRILSSMHAQQCEAVQQQRDYVDVKFMRLMRSVSFVSFLVRTVNFLCSNRGGTIFGVRMYTCAKIFMNIFANIYKIISIKYS